MILAARWLVLLQKRHGCFDLNRCFARTVLVFVACRCAHQQLSQCTTRAPRRGCAGRQNSARAFSGFELLEDSHARQTLVAEVLRTGWHAWRSRCLPGVLVRRRSTSAMLFLRDDRARVGATPSARPRSTLRGQSQSASPGAVSVAFRRWSRPRE